ncbi:MAG TPA: lytic transglycosylase domain-containing protein [Puia sp.]|nr:lytic transglycosylase domain-containing protein [Puia sp.]
MLKSLVFVALVSCLIFSGLSAYAFVPVTSSDGPFASLAGSAGTGVFSRHMQHYVDSYLKENDQELAAVRDRSYQPFSIIDSVMTHYELPVELRYLAVIESELQTGAVSRVGAKGPWQLMPGTARELGLKVGRRLDERTNYYKSTTAAALYLRDLHREFKDWLLVLAAYNAGPAPVYRAMRLSGSRNFWALEKYLPKETRGHIRRFLATEYYFAMTGPVQGPRADSDVAQVKSPDPGTSQAIVAVPGLDGAGLSDGVSGDVSGAMENGGPGMFGALSRRDKYFLL